MLSGDRFLEQIDLARRDSNVWVGPTPSGSQRRNLFGGLVAAQALRAAHLCVDAGRVPHSMHAYFLTSGRFGESVTFTVEPIRDGRSFSVRQVQASQASGVLLTLVASFQVPEQGDEYMLDRPSSPDPPGSLPVLETSLEAGTSPPGPFHLVQDPATPLRGGLVESSTVRYWAKVAEQLPSDPVIHASALVAMGDLRTGSPPRLAMRDDEPVVMTSLDYSISWRAPARADDWVMFDLRPGGNGGARGLTHGVVYDRGGQVASLAMEMLMRRGPKGEEP